MVMYVHANIHMKYDITPRKSIGEQLMETMAAALDLL